MNQNDADRYLWRTGQRWSGDDRTATESSRGTRIRGRAIILVGLAFVGTIVGLVLIR